MCKNFKFTVTSKPKQNILCCISSKLPAHLCCTRNKWPSILMLHIQHCCTCIILHLHHVAYTACYYCSIYIVLAIYCIYSIIVVCAARLLHLQHATLAYSILHLQHIAYTLPSHRICCTCSKTNFTWYHHHHQ